MTASVDIENLFLDNVFSDSSLKTTYSPMVVLYEIKEDSEVEVNALSFNRAINFFQLLIKRSEVREGLNRRRYDFQIAIKYTVEKSAKNNAFTQVRDGLEKVQDLIATEVESVVSSLIDFYEIQSTSDITLSTVADVQCWQGGLFYTGVKSVYL